jgi:RNA polymerase sigma-70 factor (ECF subfamily)
MGHSSFNVVEQLQALRSYARSLARNEADAEDLVQQTLVKAYGKRSSFRSGGNLRAWLFSILHNTFVSEWRRRTAETQRAHELSIVGDLALPNQEHAARLAQLRDAFFDLPEDQRAALHLVAIEGLSYGQAAEALNIPAGTLMSRLARARTTLRDYERGAKTTTPSPISQSQLRIVGGSDEAEQ